MPVPSLPPTTSATRTPATAVFCSAARSSNGSTVAPIAIRTGLVSASRLTGGAAPATLPI